MCHKATAGCKDESDSLLLTITTLASYSQFFDNYLLDRVENCCFEFYAMCWIVAHHLLYLYKSTFSKLSNIIEIQSII